MGRPAIAVGGWLLLLVLAAAPARAGDDPADSRDAAIARALDAANTAMKAKAEEARLLEAMGRREEALDALQEVGRIHEKAQALVSALLGTRAAAPAPRGIPARPAAPPSGRTIPIPYEPLRPRPEAPRPPARDPVPGAVEFLLKCQGEDGLFHAAAGQVADDPVVEAGHDLTVTGLVVLALLDATAPGPIAHPSAAAEEAVRRAGDALASNVGADGVLGARPEGQAYATWGLAAAFARFGTPAWAAPLRRAVTHALETQDASGLWFDPARARGETVALTGETVLLTTAMTGLLYEAYPLTQTVSMTARMEEAVERAQDALAGLPAAGLPVTAAYAIDLARWSRWQQGRQEAEEPPQVLPMAEVMTRAGPGAAPLDPLALLLATVHVMGRFDGGTLAATWQDRVLVPAMDMQRAAGQPGGGSWAPGDPRSVRYGRAYATALSLLAWAAPTAQFREPVAR